MGISYRHSLNRGLYAVIAPELKFTCCDFYCGYSSGNDWSNLRSIPPRSTVKRKSTSVEYNGSLFRVATDATNIPSLGTVTPFSLNSLSKNAAFSKFKNFQHFQQPALNHTDAFPLLSPSPKAELYDHSSQNHLFHILNHFLI